MLSSSAKWVLALLLPPTSLFAQVRIVIPKQRYQPLEQILAKLENQTSQPITVCVQIGQWSPMGDTIESTPSPFLVERNDNGKRGVLLNGPDMGNNSPPVELDSGKSLEFPNATRYYRMRFGLRPVITIAHGATHPLTQAAIVEATVPRSAFDKT
jgi:hypothetical protein